MAALLDDSGDATGPSAQSRVEALAWYTELVELSLSDGSLSAVERAFLFRAAEALDVGRYDAERVIRTARSHLYGEARAAVKAGASQ